MLTPADMSMIDSSRAAYRNIHNLSEKGLEI